MPELAPAAVRRYVETGAYSAVVLGYHV